MKNLEKVFIFKENNSKDMDCVAYINSTPSKFVCGHYFSSVKLEGACYSTRLKKYTEEEFSNLTTILTYEEYNKIIEFDNQLNNLGTGIEFNDERYIKGLELIEEIQPIFDKLNSKENKELFNKVVEEEKDFLMEEYDISIEDVEDIFEEYYLEYRDRAIVGNIFNNTYVLGEEEMWQLGYIDNSNNSFVDKYIDYEAFGEDLLKQEQYYQLEDGRIVYLNY